MSSHYFGWNASTTTDERDYKFHEFFNLKHLKLPEAYDLRTLYSLPPCYDQGQCSSCVANSTVFLYHFNEIAQKQTSFLPSRLYHYFNSRVLTDNTSSDSGSTNRAGMKALALSGVCQETTYPYDISKVLLKPSELSYIEGGSNRGLTYYSVQQTLDTMKQALVSGFPFNFGAVLFDSWNLIKADGKVPTPDLTKEKPIGSHSQAIVGYNDLFENLDGSKGAFVCRNSWGSSWADKGYAYISYSYLLNRQWCSDMWCLNKVSAYNPSPPCPVPIPTAQIKDILKNMNIELKSLSQLPTYSNVINQYITPINQLLGSIHTLATNLENYVATVKKLNDNVLTLAKPLPNLSAEVNTINNILSQSSEEEFSIV